MKHSTRNQVIALAGLAQAVHLVQQIATHGQHDSAAFKASIDSVLKIDAADVEDVYGGLENLTTGFQQLKQQLTGNDNLDRQQARYAAMLMFLEAKLVKNPSMLTTIRSGIERATTQAEHFNSVHSNVVANLAGIYQDTLSTLSPRIMINGNPTHLTNPDNANKIRALLLAGIRSIVLWEQCGGRRWKLLLQRNKMLQQIEQLVSLIE